MAEKTVRERTKVNRRVFTAREKCQAVLSVWSERRKPQEICRELGINWVVLDQWQKRAIVGMMEILEPRKNAVGEKASWLGPKLEKMLEQVVRQKSRATKLAKRLETIQAVTPVKTE